MSKHSNSGLRANPSRYYSLHFKRNKSHPGWCPSPAESTFFNKNGGAYLEFIRKGDAITGFRFYGFEASKIE